MYKRIFAVPQQSFFLLGPRGSGKSTLLKQLNLSPHVIDLLETRLFRELTSDPTRLYEQLSHLKPNTFVVIDEIQKIPELLNEVHRLIENKRLKFALTGSSAKKLRSVSANLLGGRALQKFMYPLMPQEMGKDFHLETALSIGTMPLIIDSDSPQQTLKHYVDLYLKEEIQAEALVRNLSGFIRFLPIAALMHGQKINLSTISREAGVERPTVQGFFKILEDTLLVRRLQAYQARLRVREQSKDKFYFIDPGIVRSCKNARGTFSLEEKGSLFEGLIFTMLLFQKETYGDIDQIHYWAPAESSTTEVDFLLTKGSEHIAIEVKASNHINAKELNGLRAIAELKSVRRRIAIYMGSTRRTTPDGIEILPFSSFVQQLEKKEI